MNARMRITASHPAQSLPGASGEHRHQALLARMLLIALLIWVQGLAPFVHAHAGSASTRGWHLHTGADRAAPLYVPALQPVPIELVMQQAPAGSEARAVGVSAGLPQGRDAAAEPAQTRIPDNCLPSDRPSLPMRSEQAGCDGALRPLAAAPAPCARPADLLPPNRAPPSAV